MNPHYCTTELLVSFIIVRHEIDDDDTYVKLIPKNITPCHTFEVLSILAPRLISISFSFLEKWKIIVIKLMIAKRFGNN